MARKSDKKQRLIQSADMIFLQKGLSETTLANIAHLADVPLGNVYYYFKTKSQLVSCVIKMRFQMLKDTLAKIEAEHSDPTTQLKTFIQQFLNTSNVEERNFGFMLTMMWVELGKENGELFNEFLPLPEYVIDWCAKKLEATGKHSEQANGSAFWLLASLQGACSMSKDPKSKDTMLLQSQFIEQVIGLNN